MAKKQETLEMAKLRSGGATCKAIGDLYGLSPVAVWQRLNRAGFIDSYRSANPRDINKEQLENLYAAERLPLKKIAHYFGIRVDIIKAALRLHEIPKRKPLPRTGKNIEVLKKLEIGDAVQVRLTKHSDANLYKAAQRLDIKISLRNLGSYNYKVTRVEKINKKCVTFYQQIGKKQLEQVYITEKLSLKKIAAAFDCSIMTINAALKYNEIPLRPQLKYGGKLVDALRSLAVGEQTEISSTAKRPLINIHSVAKLNGLKISVKSLGNGRYRVTRFENGSEKRAPLHQRIDKNQLENLYLVEKLSISNIAIALSTTRVTIRQALEYNNIPMLRSRGIRVVIFRKLAVGEETELICEVQHPIINLHTIARRIGIKISIKTLGGGRFRIKRVENPLAPQI